MNRVHAWPLLMTLAACAGGGDAQQWETPAYFAQSIRTSLAGGDLARAVDVAARGNARFPYDRGLLAWQALLAQMRWRDPQALELLRRLREVEAPDDADHAELLGRIGEVMFRSGAYADSVSFLNAGADQGPHAARRAALVRLARDLPYSRLQPPELAAELPLSDQPLPELLCRVGARQRAFVLDTGASFTALTRTMASELRIAPIIDAGKARDGTGRELQVAFGVLDSFSLGGVQLAEQPVLVVDDQALALRDPFGGPESAPRAVVGLDILARFRVTFDPERRSVLFELPRGLGAPRSVACVQHDGFCLVPVVIEGRSLWFVLDTGASHSSLTDQGLAALPGAVQRVRISHRRIHTPGGGQVSVREVDELSLEVSAVRFDGVTLAIVARQVSPLFPVHGVLGADLVMRCRTTFDGGRLLIEEL